MTRRSLVLGLAVASCSAAPVEQIPAEAPSRPTGCMAAIRSCEHVAIEKLAGTKGELHFSADADGERLHGEANEERICSMTWDGAAIYPWSCGPNAPSRAVCGDALTDFREKGCDLVVVDRDDRGSTHRLLLAAECWGNTMCGAFGVVRVDVTEERLVVAPPKVGCFAAPVEGLRLARPSDRR